MAKTIYVATDNCTAVTIYGRFVFEIGKEVPSYVAKKYPHLVKRVEVESNEETEEKSTKKGRKKNG